MEFKDILWSRRRELGITLDDIARHVGVSGATVSRWEHGDIENIKRDKIAKLAEVLKVSPGYLMGWTEHHVSPSAVRIPVLGTIPAGIPLEAIEDVLDWEEISTDMVHSGHEYFALKIHGNSMQPTYQDGDVIIVQQQDTADTGDDAVVFVNGDDATFKRISRSERGIILKPLNPDYEPLIFTNKQIIDLPIRILGVAVEIRRKLR